MITKYHSTTIPNVTKLTERWTKQIVVGAVPWQFQIWRTDYKDEDSLCVHLFCNARDDQKYAASAKMTLLGRERKEKIIEANVFDGSGLGTGRRLCKWSTLINKANGFLRKDAIQIEFAIYMSRGSQAELTTTEIPGDSFLLYLKNANQLMAVRSETFQKKEQKWQFLIHTASNGELLVGLERIDDCKQYASNVIMTVKIKSRKGKRKCSFTKTDSKRFGIYETHDIHFDAPWERYFLSDEAQIDIQLIFD